MWSRNTWRVGIAAALALSTSAALAMQADQLDVNKYGKSGVWTLRVATAGGDPQICDAVAFTGSEQGLFFEYNPSTSAIGFSGYGSAAESKAIDVEIWFDNKRAQSQVLSMGLEPDATGYEWRMYRTTNDEPNDQLDGFSNSSKVHFVYTVPGEGEHEEAFSLKGSNKAVKQTIDCMGDLSQTSPQAPMNDTSSTDVATNEEVPPDLSEVVYGDCRLIVGGMTYIDIKHDCPIWLENDGKGTLWINTDRNSDLPDYFAELEPNGDGTATAHWNGEPGATHAQALLGENLRLGKGGCWSNKTATLCAAK